MHHPTPEEGLITSWPIPHRSYSWNWWSFRLSAGIVGLVLFTAGFLKSISMERFVVQLRDYGIVWDYGLLVISAWTLIILEYALGVALILSYRPRLIFPLTVAFLLVIQGVNGWAWFNNTTQECGCFGVWLKRSPGEAMVETLVLLAMTVFAWIVLKHNRLILTRAKAWAVIGASLLGLILPVTFGFSITQIGQSQWKRVQAEVNRLDLKGMNYINLRHGTYLIVLIDTDSPDCQVAVPELNILSEKSDFPSVIGLCANKEGQQKIFVEDFQPTFRMGRINENAFWRLFAEGEMPRSILVYELQVRQVWDGALPTSSMIGMTLPD